MSGYSKVCESCGGTRFASTRHVNVFGCGASLVRCAGCGLKFYDRLPVQDFWDHHNTIAYDELADATVRCGSMCNRDPAQAEYYRATTAAYYGRCVDRLREVAGGRLQALYEMGFGSGEFLLAAEGRGVMGLAGCDASRRNVALAHERIPAARVEHGFFADVPRPPDGSQDAVVMLDCIEHTTTPRGDLERAFALLRPGGALLVKTFYDEWHDTLPNLDLSPARMANRTAESVVQAGVGVTGYFSPVAHPHHFDEPVLLALIERVGFRVATTERTPSCGQITVWGVRP